MTPRPPIHDFEPFEPSRVRRIRDSRAMSWVKAQVVKMSKPRTKEPSVPRVIPGIAHLDAATQDRVRQALKNLGM